MVKLSKSLSAFVLILSLLVLAACTSTEQSTEESSPAEKSDSGKTTGKSIYVGITNTPGSFNPINTRDNSSIHLSSVLFDSFFDLDESMNFQPKLAQSLETSDNMNFVINLNPEAKWTDGQPVTTDDIVFTLQLMANPEVTSLGLQSLSVIDGLDENGHLPDGATNISGLEAVDSHTLKIHTKIPVDPNFLKEKLGVDIRFLPKHVLEDVEPDKLHQHPFMQKPTVTNGPFKFVAYAKDQHVEYAANQDYYRGAPKIDKLFFKIMPSANLVAQLQSGEIHMNFPGIGQIAIEDTEKVKNMSNVRTVTGKPTNYQMMFMNMETITSDKARQAIAHAINRQLLVDSLLQGEGEVFEGPYTPVHPYHNKNVETYSYEPETAKQLLQEAGWDFNKTIDLAVPIGNKTREQAAVIIAENLQAVGLKVQVNKYDLPTIMQKGQNHEFDLLMLGIPFKLDPDMNQWYYSSGVYNFSSYKNIDALMDKGVNEADPVKRKAIYDEIQEVMQQDLPSLSLYSEYNLGAVSTKVKVGEPKTLGMLYNVHEWDIEE